MYTYADNNKQENKSFAVANSLPGRHTASCWEKHNTYLLREEGDYRLFGLNAKELNSANIILVHKDIKVMEGTATGEFANRVQYAKLLLNAYIWKYENKG